MFNFLFHVKPLTQALPSAGMFLSLLSDGLLLILELELNHLLLYFAI
jgi:hypothetical protein